MSNLLCWANADPRIKRSPVTDFQIPDESSEINKNTTLELVVSTRLKKY